MTVYRAQRGMHRRRKKIFRLGRVVPDFPVDGHNWSGILMGLDRVMYLMNTFLCLSCEGFGHKLTHTHTHTRTHHLYTVLTLSKSISPIAPGIKCWLIKVAATNRTS